MCVRVCACVCVCVCVCVLQTASRPANATSITGFYLSAFVVSVGRVPRVRYVGSGYALGVICSNSIVMNLPFQSSENGLNSYQ